MNHACRTVKYFWDLLDDQLLLQPAISREVSRQLGGDETGGYSKPHQQMFKDLEAFSGKLLFCPQAIQLKVVLDLGPTSAWRRLLVPLNTAFDKLHRILQTAFGWKNYHLHEYYIYDQEVLDKNISFNHPARHPDGFKPILNLASSQEALSYDYDDGIPMQLDKGVRISDYIPARMKYIYDFGDFWQHYIEVEGIVEDYDKNYPVCLAGEGNTPPEDVGGTGGYERFLAIMEDENHSDYENMLNWSKHQGYQKLNLDYINVCLKYL